MVKKVFDWLSIIVATCVFIAWGGYIITSLVTVPEARELVLIVVCSLFVSYLFVNGFEQILRYLSGRR